MRIGSRSASRIILPPPARSCIEDCEHMTAETLESYRQLELEPGASPEAIRAAYRDLVKVWHPDRFLPGSELQKKAQARLKAINLAYEWLKSASNDARSFERSAAPQSSNGATQRTKDDACDVSNPTSNSSPLPKTSWGPRSLLDRWIHHGRGNPWILWPSLLLLVALSSVLLGSIDGVKVLLWKRAAERGDTGAQTELAWCYYRGEGEGKNPALALKWAQAAADPGALGGQRLLAILYWEGDAVPQDYSQAFRWMTLSANRGDAPAQAFLGHQYEFGRGVGQDEVEALKWYTLAAAQQISVAAKARNRLRKKLFPTQVAEAQIRAASFKPTR